MVVAKSPLTDLYGQANSAGFWGTNFKRSGFDGVIFEGISPKPVYLVTDEGKAELKDAGHLWGKNTSETTRLIREELGDRFRVACIGPAGENLVKYAAIINDRSIAFRDSRSPSWRTSCTNCDGRCIHGFQTQTRVLSSIDRKP